MKLFARFLEEIPLGVVDDPHSERPIVLTEMVTVCPACRSLHSLRHNGKVVHCVECFWSTAPLEPVQAA